MVNLMKNKITVLFLLLAVLSCSDNPDEPEYMFEYEQYVITDSFPGVTNIEITDIDNDGDIDIIGSSYSANCITAWLNDGEQNFSSLALVTYLEDAYGIFPADFNNDSLNDILCTDYNSDRIIVLINTGGLTYSQITVADDSDSFGACCVTDYNGDGYYDILRAGSSVDIFINNKDQSFTKSTVMDDTGTAVSVFEFDHNNDGYTDFIYSDRTNDCLKILSNNGDGTFSLLKIGTTTYVEGLFLSKPVDFNSDGNTDLIVSHVKNVMFLENNGESDYESNPYNDSNYTKNFLFHECTSYSETGFLNNINSMAVIDFDDDEDYDIICSGYLDTTVEVLINKGANVFSSTIISSDYQEPYKSIPVDLDNDDDPDIVSCSQTTNSIVWFEAKAVPVEEVF